MLFLFWLCTFYEVLKNLGKFRVIKIDPDRLRSAAEVSKHLVYLFCRRRS